jgi:hypothetical protein
MHSSLESQVAPRGGLAFLFGKEGDEMKRFGSVVLLLLVLGFLAPAEAVLIDRGTGMIYDTDLNITWYDTAPVNGSWPDLTTWATNLSVTNTNGSSITGWRLPKTIDGPNVYSNDGITAAGYNNTSGELGHLFYKELGNKGYYDVNGNYQPGYGRLNTGPFKNLQYNYWTGTEYASDTSLAWNFNFF